MLKIKLGSCCIRLKRIQNEMDSKVSHQEWWCNHNSSCCFLSEWSDF